MPLALDDRKLLPEGVHDATLMEVDELFARVQKSDRRLKLFARLQAYLDAVKKAECGISVVLNGSFVMGCVDEPSDIDLVLVLPKDWDLDADLKPYQYNLVSKRRVRKDFRFDIATVTSGSVEERNWVTFFSKISRRWRREFGWPDDAKKGIVRVHL
jgi:predicted nucleotidyltransferase